MKYEEIQVGTTQQLTHTITQADIEKFVDLSGDDNKLHEIKRLQRVLLSRNLSYTG